MQQRERLGISGGNILVWSGLIVLAENGDLGFGLVPTNISGWASLLTKLTKHFQ